MLSVKAPQLFFISLLVILLCNGLETVAVTNMNIGAIVDTDTRVGKEVKTAMEIALQGFNDYNSFNYNISPYFVNPASNPLQAAYAAEELIKEKKVQVVIVMKTWQETALIADVGTQAKIPILSLTSGGITPPSALVRWPFLVQMANDGAHQIQCIADMVLYYRWRRVIVIYEDDAYGGDSGILALLSEALQHAGSEIEHRLIIPPFSSLTNPIRYVRNELLKLLTKQTRAFIILRSSLPLATHIFEEANQMGFMGQDSAWIVTSFVADLFDSLKYSSVISSMDGVLGVKTYYPQNTSTFEDFRVKFRQKFNEKYPEEDNKDPGFYALRAYDGITVITLAIKHMTITANANTSTFLQNILSTSFDGLSGKIHFNDGQYAETPVFRITNVIAKSYRELDFWTAKFGFSKDQDIIKLSDNTSTGYVNRDMYGPVYWPGDLVARFSKGWAMPTSAKPMNIGVPARTAFEKFVKVEWSKETNNWDYSGFCIELFYAILDRLKENYTLPYEFHPYNGTYDDLVDHVYNRTFDAVIGDVTILANRSKYVEFTQPYAESGLTLIVPVREEDHAWIFMKPFTREMWLATGGVLLYTVFIVWLLEHRSNPEFRGPWKNQIGTAFWFTFSSLFFAHKEKIHSNLTRIVVITWLFVVLVLNSSYTASFTSMLTVRRLQPNVTDIDWLLRTKSPVGCDGDSFIRKYLVDVLRFDANNVMNINSLHNYPGEFQSGNISAAFLELPYEKVFMNQFCQKYTSTLPTIRFGGLGFAFQKGSPIARDFSEAILLMSEDGKLQELSNKWFSSPKACSSDTTTETESLGLTSFLGLYIISISISTLCSVIFLVRFCKNYRRHREQNGGTLTPVDKSVWDKTIMVLQYFDKGGIKVPGRTYAAAPSPALDDDWISPELAFEGTSVDSTPNRSSSFERSPALEIEIVQIPAMDESFHSPTQPKSP